MLAVGLSTVVLATGTALAAVANFSTGIPVVDRLLQVDGPSMGLVVGPSGATDPIRLPLGSDFLSVVAYATPANNVCVAQGVSRTRDDRPEGGLGGCFPASGLAEILARDGVVWATATTIGDHRLFLGYVDAAVAEVRVRNTDGPTTVRLTPPWTPPKARPIRLLAIYDRAPGLARDKADSRRDDLTRLLTDDPQIETFDEAGHPIAPRR